MSMWIFIGRTTGMPIEAQKCDFEPTIRPIANGDWYKYVGADACEALRAELAARNCLDESSKKEFFALRAERDELAASNLAWSDDCIKARSERDALAARVEKLREALDTYAQFNFEGEITLVSGSLARRALAEDDKAAGEDPK